MTDLLVHHDMREEASATSNANFDFNHMFSQELADTDRAKRPCSAGFPLATTCRTKDFTQIVSFFFAKHHIVVDELKTVRICQKNNRLHHKTSYKTTGMEPNQSWVFPANLRA